MDRRSKPDAARRPPPESVEWWVRLVRHPGYWQRADSATAAVHVLAGLPARLATQAEIVEDERGRAVMFEEA